jgi:hypothetical protein
METLHYKATFVILNFIGYYFKASYPPILDKNRNAAFVKKIVSISIIISEVCQMF